MNNRKKRFVISSVIFVCIISFLVGYAVCTHVSDKTLNNDSRSTKQSKNFIDNKDSKVNNETGVEEKKDKKNENTTSAVKNNDNVKDDTKKDTSFNKEKEDEVKQSEDMQHSLKESNHKITKEDGEGVSSNSEKFDTKTIRVVNEFKGDSCAQALDYYYEDENYMYYFTCKISNYVFVYVGGKKYTISYALKNKIVTINDIESSGFRVLKKSKNTVSE